jgi:hypothetical protein
MEKKYHYVYEILYCTELKYIGVRSCNCNIEDDTYMGSAFHIPDEVRPTGVKTILSIHTSRLEAMEEEIRLHSLYDVKDNPLYYNQCNSTSTKFIVSKEGIAKSAQTRTGRTAESHEYIAKQVKAREKYHGEGLTPAQKEQWNEERREERLAKYRKSLQETLSDPERASLMKEALSRGGKWGLGKSNPAKGLRGLAHSRAEAWWYIHPTNGFTVVNDSVRNYCKTNQAMFPFSSATIMRYLRDNKLPTSVKAKGWDFGKINGQELTNPAE